jgi:uncharacterized protein YkwD
MADNKDWYYELQDGPRPLVRGPVSLEEMGFLIHKGTIRSDTLVRFGTDTRWYAASNFVLLKQFPEPAPAHASSPSRKLPLIGLAVVILVLLFVYFPRGREMAVKYAVLPLPQRTMVSPAQGSRLSVTGIIQCTNRARAENGGLPPLSRNSLLDTIASERADDMIQKQYFSHYSPSGEGVTDVAQRTGYRYKHLGENIAMGSFQTDEKIVTAWMQSPGHRQNILSDGCSEIGVAVKRGWMKGEEVWIGVQIFGQQSPAVAADSGDRRRLTYASANSNDQRQRECRPPEESLLDDITKAKTELDGLSEQAASLHKEISADKPSGISGIDIRELTQKVAAYNELVNEISSRRRAALHLISSYNQSVERYNTCIAN